MIIIDNKNQFRTQYGKNGISHWKDRYFTRIGFMQRHKVIMETPVMLYSNNPAGGEISANEIGAFTFISYNPEIRNTKKIGRLCSIAQNVTIGMGGHSTTALSHHQIFEIRQGWAERFWDYDESWVNQMREKNVAKEPRRKSLTSIGNDVWIGANAFITQGVSVGDGSVIAAGSVVTHDVPAYSIVGGVPGSVIRFKYSEKMIERLETTQWWDYGPNILKGLDISAPQTCIDELEDRIRSNKYSQYVCDKFEFDPATGTITKISVNGDRSIVCVGKEIR